MFVVAQTSQQLELDQTMILLAVEQVVSQYLMSLTVVVDEAFERLVEAPDIQLDMELAMDVEEDIDQVVRVVQEDSHLQDMNLVGAHKDARTEGRHELFPVVLERH
jgi:mevalonate pyrophosphate decarboxylase